MAARAGDPIAGTESARRDRPRVPAAPQQRPVPTFDLYGEQRGGRATPLLPGPLHCESIASRSRLHGWEIRPHRHDAFFQILYIRSGTGEARFGARTVPIRPPCVLAVAPPLVHGFRFSRDVDGHVLTVLERHLQALLPGAPALLQRLGDSLCLSGEPVTRGGLGEALARLVAELEGTAPWREAAVQAHLGTALVALARAVDALDGHDDASADDPRDRHRERARGMPAGAAQTGVTETGTTETGTTETGTTETGVTETATADRGIAGPGSMPGRRGERHLRRFRALVDRHFREHPPIAFYAERLGITPTQLNRVCRDTLGRSALGVVNDRLRLEAERDLVYTSLDVKAIALQLGFTDAAYFTRFFAKQAGRTPTAFRNAARALLAAGP